MLSTQKNQQEILEKLGIEALNPMQEKAKFTIHSNPETILLSPTGTGKTLAFMLPVIAELDSNCDDIQTLILVPSRELAIQIEQVTRDMGTGFKANAFYGGRSFSKDRADLNRPPAILIGTPGRIADHLRRGSFSVENLKTLILDEFDKSLEVGFEGEMTEILDALPNIGRKVLTSATQGVEIPEFVDVNNPEIVDFLDQGVTRLQVKTVISPSKDKLDTLAELLNHIGDEPGIIFCNFKESIRRVSDFLNFHKIDHGCFYGGMEQSDRENALIKFRNGTDRLLIATDLAARGIDVPEMKFIVHYHLPLKSEEFTHRNGRTARMNANGTAFVIKWAEEELPGFIQSDGTEELNEASAPSPTLWKTLYISGGRRDKISKGDIAGLFFKQGNLDKDELGVIELKQDCAFVAVKSNKVDSVINKIDNSRLKKRKVKVRLI